MPTLYIHDLKKEDGLKYEEDPKNKDNLPQDDLKNEDDLKYEGPQK